MRILQNGRAFCRVCLYWRRLRALEIGMGRSKIVGALPRMPLQVLRYAISISEHGSTLSGAQVVTLTSSALSRQISQLEHELGLKLFERHSRGMRPTSEGEVF